MPTYAYACKDCGHAFDIQQSFSDDSLTVCPACRGKLRKKFNSVGVVFKGSGFYRTDSRSGSSTVPAAGSASGASGSESGSAAPAAASASTTGAGSGSASGSAVPSKAPASVAS